MFKTIVEVIGSVEPLLSTVKRRKLAHFGHTMRHESLHKLITQGFVEGKRRRGRPRTKRDIGGILESAMDRDKWKKTCVIASIQLVMG